MVALFREETLPEPTPPFREGLTDAQQARLREICDPTYPNNPFNRQTRIRNQAVVHLLLDAPLRRGEFLKLQLEDLQLNGPPGEGLVKVVVRFDEKDDPRRLEPRQKTLGRHIPISDQTKRMLIRYLRVRFSKWPFVFASTRGDGRPMEQSSVNDIFAVIAKAFPDEFLELYPHILRHTWNDNYILRNQGEKEEKLKDTELTFTQNYLNGWSDKGNTGRRYHRRATGLLANKTLRKYQARE
jgi:integrase